MKTKDIVKSLRSVLDRDGKKKKGALKKILKKLKRKEIALKKKLGAAQSRKAKKALVA